MISYVKCQEQLFQVFIVLFALLALREAASRASREHTGYLRILSRRDFFRQRRTSGPTILQRLIYARMEAATSIFGKVDFRKLAMHCQARPPHNVKKSPPLNVKNYSRPCCLPPLSLASSLRRPFSCKAASYLRWSSSLIIDEDNCGVLCVHT